ncbi:SH3 domain-containing protein [Mesorhizobium sp.]|uniref:SH3 domain-containing protein n=1 Tax=Mesorhizobium sp. TaxID=1871066 RepID=UPI0025C01A95|nr:SH3 domain-containing protein [Mesorhizobium sp.]
MREPFSFGVPERRRLAMQFGYDMRPRFWQKVRSNLHLVIAALGTAALLGVAAVALWLALPANERQAVASSEQAVPSVPVKTTEIVPAAASAIAAVQQATDKTDVVSTAAIAAEAEIPALAPNDPRWTGSGSKTKSGRMAGRAEQAADKPSMAAFADPAAKNKAAALFAKVAAPGKTATDDAQTAAIPTPKPQLPAATQADGSQAKVEAKDVSAADTGRILRAVTMRTGPKKNAAAIVTVPAKTPVQVMGCKKWCQIIYNGKRGWIYKSFIKTGA